MLQPLNLIAQALLTTAFNNTGTAKLSLSNESRTYSMVDLHFGSIHIFFLFMVAELKKYCPQTDTPDQVRVCTGERWPMDPDATLQRL